MSRPSVVIVDDHDGFCASARLLLEAEGFDVVATASEAVQALSATTLLRPDLVLLDIQLPGIDGFEVARSLADLPRRPAVVLTSSRPAAAFGDRIRDAPVRGFLAKHELSGDALASFLD
jgi:DNA-binding NarL/FixJ family response regulator